MFRRGKLILLSAKDDRVKVINERIDHTEKHIIDICHSFATCARRLAKFRDAYDELSQTLQVYAEEEEINKSLIDGLKNSSNAVTLLGDYMDLEVQRIESKIINELAQFENLFKTTRDDLRVAILARDKEVLKQKQMLEIKTKFSSNNEAADSELFKAKMEVNRRNKEIDNIINNFEKRKLTDLKQIFIDFILINMKYHVKSLEVLTANYHDMSKVDEKDDLRIFRKLLKNKWKIEDTANTKKDNLSNLRSQSLDNLDADQALSSFKIDKKKSSSIKNLTDTEQEEDNNDDDDDDDDDAESDQNDSEEYEEEDDDDEQSESTDDGNTDDSANTNKNEFKKKDPIKKDNLNIKKLSKTNISKHLESKSIKEPQGTIGVPPPNISKIIQSKPHVKKIKKKSKHDDDDDDLRRQVTVVETKQINENSQQQSKDIIDCTKKH